MDSLSEEVERDNTKLKLDPIGAAGTHIGDGNPAWKEEGDKYWDENRKFLKF